ncbi:MAG: class I SAM-dependent methyltransferase, partial [Stellaceae bacterium]
GHYRFSTFAEANAAVYQNRPLMEKYLNGILLSHVLWANHAVVFEYYAKAFLAKNRSEYRHLEVGPGHGLLLYEAASDRRCGSVTGWDVSPTSLSHTETCLKRLGVERPVALAERDLMAGDLDGQFDSIVISEVLEHLERPDMALSRLGSVLAPGGFLFAHVPINSPTVDHIFLWRLPEDFIDLVRRSGFDVVDWRCVPCTGYSERQARRMALTISCAVIATAAA